VREVVLAFAVSLTPVFTSFHATGDKESLRSSLISSCRSALLLAMFPSLFLFAFARPFLALWVGSAYATESSVILQLAILNVLISAPSIVAYEALVGLGRIRSVAVMMIIGGVFNILLAIVLADSFGFGLVGVAISMIVSYGIVACSYIMRSAMRELGVPLREFLAQAVVAPVFIWVAWVLVAFALQTYISPQSWLMLGVQFALVGFAFNVSVYTLLLSKSDKSSIREIRQKISATIRQAFLSNSSRRQGLPTKPVVSD
jgi:O-antigen/teichoic acid export membrane protein